MTTFAIFWIVVILGYTVYTLFDRWCTHKEEMFRMEASYVPGSTTGETLSNERIGYLAETLRTHIDQSIDLSRATDRAESVVEENVV